MVEKGIVLGHVVSLEGMQVDKAKIEIISNLPIPRTVRDIKSFSGHARFYRRFIKDFSTISRPLSNLLAKDASFEGIGKCQDSFDQLKTVLTAALTL